MPLQRVIVDFGADDAFGRVVKKLLEHYGIEMAVSTIRAITEKHAQQIAELRRAKTIPNQPGCPIQIGEMDDSYG